MVNAAFSHDETNAQAMETALSLLRSMADKGNAYLASRHSLLLELRAAIGPKPTTNDAQRISLPPNVPATPPGDRIASPPPLEAGPISPTLPSACPQQVPDLPSFQDISFHFDLNDDPALWEGALDQIDIDMDTDWIEDTLKR